LNILDILLLNGLFTKINTSETDHAEAFKVRVADAYPRQYSQLFKQFEDSVQESNKNNWLHNPNCSPQMAS